MKRPIRGFKSSIRPSLERALWATLKTAEQLNLALAQTYKDDQVGRGLYLEDAEALLLMRELFVLVAGVTEPEMPE